MKALIDGDVYLYQAVHRGLTAMSFDGEHYIYAFDLSELLSDFSGSIRGICAEVRTLTGADNVEPIICLSSRENFRKKRINPDYKANRAPKKPLAFKALKDAVMDEYAPRVQKGLEADDLLGIYHTSRGNRDTVVCSIDKDMLTLPGLCYNTDKGTLVDVSPIEAERYFLRQVLIGDRVDNYFGVPGVGEKTALSIFEQSGYSWDTVVGTYESRGLTEKDALMNARCAYILRHKDFSFERKKVRLWTPKKLKHCV